MTNPENPWSLADHYEVLISRAKTELELEQVAQVAKENLGEHETLWPKLERFIREATLRITEPPEQNP